MRLFRDRRSRAILPENEGPPCVVLRCCSGLTLSISSLPGCLVISETRRDQDKIRTTLNTLYEDQIIDNLIRAANGLPFVQMDCTNATTTVTVTESGNVGGTQTTGPNCDQTSWDRYFVSPIKFTKPASRHGAIKSVEDFKASLPLAGKVFLRNSHQQPPTTSKPA